MMMPRKKDLELYRGDTTTYQFIINDIDPANYVSISIRFAAIRTDNNKAVLDFEIYPNDPGNDWAQNIVQANISSGMTQLIECDRSIILRYDIEVVRDDGSNQTVVTEYFGDILFIADVTVSNPVITPLTEANLKNELASTLPNKGASMVGVDSTIWGSIASNVQQALSWLKSKIAALPTPWIPNRLIRTTSNVAEYDFTDIVVTTNNTLTGAKTITATDQPTDDDHLTRKDYVDNQDSLRVLKTGDTMTGNLTIPAGTAPGHAINLSQLDARIVNSVNWSNPSTTDTASQNAINSRIQALISAINTQDKTVISLNNNDTININSIFATSGDGYYLVFDSDDANTFGIFMYHEGTPSNASIFAGSTNFVNTDTANNLCLIQSSNDILLKNRLGTDKNIVCYRSIV